MEVYNMAGRRVDVLFDGTAEANVLYSNLFDVRQLPKGTYLYKLVTGDRTKTGFIIPVQ